MLINPACIWITWRGNETHLSLLFLSAAHQLSPLCCDKESAPDVSPGNRATLHVKEEHDRRTDQRGPSCRQQCDTLVSPQTVKRGHRDPSLHLHRILHVEQTSNIKAEPDNDELITSPASREAEIRCGRTRESLKGEERTGKRCHTTNRL